RFNVKSWGAPLLSLLRRPPALRSWINGHGLCERCLPTARPLAVLHRRRFGLLCQGYLLTLEVPEAVELPGFLDTMVSLPRPERLTVLRDRIDQTARLVRELHYRGVSHRDLKGANILTTAFPVVSRERTEWWVESSRPTDSTGPRRQQGKEALGL